MAVENIPPELRLLETHEVMGILNVSENTVRRLVLDRRLPVVQYRPGGRLHYKPDDVAALLRTRGDP